ncbi:hypothetical protein EIP91_004263 [Steccherinum ochraceum]|uniref:3-beta hydroxysteroid dehydrogenase/isomerase domain-containing protein n=1 Tax=Steccherinum ochraceum TaxID=92696 RepID=A0A4R0RBN1_9APHY|nr:hypothetical protein EIP91_004263 [Steccherinum ochraceum]
MYVGNAAHAHILAASIFLSTSSSEHPPSICGQVFFITNDAPRRAWTVHRLFREELGSNDDDGSKKVLVLPRWLAKMMACVLELWAKITGNRTDFRRFSVMFLTAIQWYNIRKTKTLLDYEPVVSLEDGLKRTAKWWIEQHFSPQRSRKVE